jgi:DNA-binding GntR family transcriptional regulator
MATQKAPRTAKAAATKRPADVVDRVYRQVKEMAIEYRFRPGERVNEVELAQRFSVSRTPVRQALSRLVHEEFVTFVPNRGFYAREIRPEDVRQIYEHRALIECGAYRLACQRGTPEQIDRAERAWTAQAGADRDFEKLAEADEAFHMAIAEMAENPHITAALRDVNGKLRFFRRIDLENPARWNNTYDEHAAVLECLRRKDPAGADILRTHIVMSSAHAVEVTKEGLARIFFENGHHAGRG